MGINIEAIGSGGQTGVDRAALDIAKKYDLNIKGFCPKGGGAEDYNTPPGILKDYPELVETATRDITIRTKLNAKRSDATLIVAPLGFNDFPGTNFTLRCCKKFSKPTYVVDNRIKSENMIVADEIRQGLYSLTKKGINLNVAGYRESKCPGIYHETYFLLDNLFNMIL